MFSFENENDLYFFSTNNCDPFIFEKKASIMEDKYKEGNFEKIKKSEFYGKVKEHFSPSKEKLEEYLKRGIFIIFL